jgi:hypothetical protein
MPDLLRQKAEHMAPSFKENLSKQEDNKIALQRYYLPVEN